jgi:hypothetical protein
MTVAQPALDLLRAPETPFGAVVARQLSVWPFAARTARLFLLVDPSLPDESLRGGLLRAMQQAYFASDGHSQTRAIREAALAAHYVLRHHNRDALQVNQVNAASAVAALRGDVAFVALAGHAAAFAWCDGELTGQRSMRRLPRPLGLEQDPLITLWSASLVPGDRLVLVCGAAWRRDSSRTMHEILSSASSDGEAEEQLAQALGDRRPAGVLVVSPAGDVKPTRHLRLVHRSDAATPTAPSPARRPFALRRWLTSLFGVALLAMVVLAALTIVADPPRQSYEATTHMAPMLALPSERIERVSPAMAVRLGPSAANVVDLAAGDDALYTLDVSEGSVRAFALDALDQLPNPSTLLARTGAPLDTGGRRLAPPVAIEYLESASVQGGALAVIDQSRTVVQIDRDRRLSVRPVPTSASWQALGALGSDAAGHLFFVDSASRRLFAYPPLSQRILDPPGLVLDAAAAPALPFEHVAQVVGMPDAVVARLDDGSVHLFGADGSDELLAIRPSDGRPVVVRSMAADRSGGLYLADTANARVLQVALDGSVVREIRDPTLAGVRQIEASLDSHRLYGLVASGVLVFDIPPM